MLTYGGRTRKNGVDGAKIMKTGNGNEAHRYTRSDVNGEKKRLTETVLSQLNVPTI